MIKLIEDFKDYLTSQYVSLGSDEIVQVGSGVSKTLIVNFESNYNVSIPDDYKYFLKLMGSETENIYHELATFCAFNRITRIIDYFKLHEVYYSPDYYSYPMQFPVTEYSKILRSPLEYDSKKNTNTTPKWLLPDAECYFYFADYNIEGSHCAIKLKRGDENLIVIIAEHVNTYRYAYNSFSELVKAYLIDGAEALL
jgi:hypothetical protein